MSGAVRALASLALAGLAVSPPVAAAAQGYPQDSRAARVRTAVALAKQRSDAGRFSDAAASYAAVLQDAAAVGGELHASALFGHASAVQQAAALPDSVPLSTELTASLNTAYQTAARLDSGRYFGAANNNAGLLLLKEGKAREAAGRFVAAAGTSHPAKAYFWWNAGHAYEAAGLPDRAADAYRRCLVADSSYDEGRRSLLSLDLRAHRADSILARAGRWQRFPAAAAAVNDALLSLLEGGGKIAPALADSALLTLAQNFTVTRPAPEFFAASLASRLDSAARARPLLREAIDALREAYRPRARHERYRGGAVPKWWTKASWDPKLAPASRRGVWSTTLRIRGDYYRIAGSPDVAASFYEGAIGYPDELSQPWVDLDALLPLVLIYLQPDAAGSRGVAGLQNLDQFVDVVFMGKGTAYAANDYRRVRYFHMALGQVFAEQKRWGSRSDSRSAIFQLEHMRRATAAVQRESREHLEDPPELLELLAEGYQVTGQRQLARETAVAAKEGFARASRSGDVARIQQRYLDQSVAR